MFRMKWLGVMVLSAFGTMASAQTAWDVLEDSQSLSVCGVINAVNAATGAPIELVILSQTSQLMIVSEADVVLIDTFVDADNNVFDRDDPRGFIAFATDADGFRTVWWVSLDGTVVEVDPFTAEIFAGVSFPDEFSDVPCDACNFVDSPPVGVCSDLPIDVPPLVVNFCGSGTGGAAMIMLACCLFASFTRHRRRRL